VTNFLKGLFQPQFHAKSVFPFSTEEMNESVKINRHSLSLVENWIDDKAFKSSWFNYGVPDFIKDVINKPISGHLTYSDLMLFIAKKYLTRLNYLEIGVSVGKNFFQMMNGLQSARFTGFDIEEINPVIEKKLMLQHNIEWETPPKSIKKNKSSFKTYAFQNTEVNYLCADVWDTNSWARLKGNKFNLIFSDALHSPEAILFEFENLVKYELLDDKFVIVWDDLVGKMKKSFFKIIKKYNQIYKLQDIYLLNINGWVGENENQHSVGLISNFPF
jgi:hypothetical protein